MFSGVSEENGAVMFRVDGKAKEDSSEKFVDYQTTRCSSDYETAE
jgi:hypothetical protein